MNKFILIALVATAAAGQDSCATAEELQKSNMEDYKLKYKFTSATKPTDLTKATPISYDKDGNIVDNVKLDTTFKIEGWPAKKETPAGFRIYSQDKSKVLSWNQPSLSGKGYYMFDTADRRFFPGGSYPYYTLFNYTDKDKRLEYMDDDSNKFKAGLQVYTGQSTLFYQSGTGPTQFCFVKVITPYVKLDSMTSKCEAGGYDSITKKEECELGATSLNLTFKDSTEINFQPIVPPGCYFEEKAPNVGVWFNPNSASTADGTKYNDYPICKRKVPKTQCKVDTTLVGALNQLHAEFKDIECGNGKMVDVDSSCTATCTDTKKTSSAKYICQNDGTWKYPNPAIDCKTVPVPKTCAVDDQTPKLGLNAEFKAKECGTGKTIDSGKTCTATCKAGKTGTVTTAKYTCKDGKLTSPTTIDCSKDSTKTCKVNDFSNTLKKLYAKFTEPKCKAGSTIQENDDCEASCENGKGDNVKYTCHNDGNFKPEAKDIACTSSFVQIGVLGALFCLFALN